MTTHSTAKEATMLSRTYETFSVRWERGSTWSGYDTEAEAQAVVDFAAARSGSVGHVDRKVFSVEVAADKAHLYRPGIVA